MASDIVLVVGGSGFLGQHIVKELQQDSSVKEIRILDIKPYKNNLGQNEEKPIKMFTGNIEEKDSIKEPFKNVDCVFHCAALVSYDFPPNEEALKKTNVEGTRNVVELCKEFNVPILIFTSSTEVTLRPYFKCFTSFALVVNQTEAKLTPKKGSSQFLFPGYPESKFRAEEIVLDANNTDLNDGRKLRTVSLRPTLMYGEEDYKIIPSIMRVGEICEGSIWQISGPGGKHQISYVGNVAWAHICAKRTLLEKPLEVSGQPIFITDDTPLLDITKSCVRLTNDPNKPKNYNISSWKIPYFVSFIVAFLLELLMKIFYPSIITKKFPVSPKALVSFMGSILLYNRLRASIRLLYEPKYTYEDSYRKSLEFYTSSKVENSVKSSKSMKYLLFR